ncbi:41814_t:CDS:2 [Gigaspora margarita]|uniref:41814_t:CDS:1 n=1 Tax=Gigaspora margarita TaxID=4874 RepID=A0ABN7VM12_GIGMA|nr:41814_t:CDS:2 [Gigaspora margarita]
MFEYRQKSAKLSKADIVYMVGHYNRMRVENKIDIKGNVRMMYVERINKGIESIKQKYDLEIVKPKVGNVNKDKGKDANVTEVCKNDEVSGNLTDDMGKSNTHGFCSACEVSKRYSSPKAL